MKSYFKAAGTSAGTHAQARAPVKVLTSVSTSVEYATAKDFLEINTGSKGYAVFNLDGKGLGAHQYLLKAFFEHNQGTSLDPVIKFLRARENEFWLFVAEAAAGDDDYGIFPFELSDDDKEKFDEWTFTISILMPSFGALALVLWPTGRCLFQHPFCGPQCPIA